MTLRSKKNGPKEGFLFDCLLVLSQEVFVHKEKNRVLPTMLSF